MKKPLRVLMVEDSEDDALLEIRVLKKGGYEPEYERVETAEAMRTALREKTWDIILCDYQMPKFNGLAAIALLKETGIDIPLIIVSGAIGEETAVACMKAGANDYIMKNNLPRLVPAIERELQEAKSRSKRRQAEEALRESSQRLAFALQSGGLGVWDWNPQTGAVVYSDLWAQILEYRPDEVEPTVDFFKRHIHPEDLEAVLDRLTRHVEGPLPIYESEHRMRTKSGRWLWVMDRGKVVERDKDGSPVRVTGIIADITARKQAEAEKAELEAQNRQLQKAESLGRMAGAIVHHFNNMLQVIIGNMQLAIRQLPRDSGSVKNMTAAMQAAREAEAITNQTMTYLGDTSDKLEPLDLCDVCRLGLPMLQAAIPKNVILETDLPSRGPTITANANQMQQVLTNLLTNAWESVGDGQGVIHLRVKMVSAADIATIHSPADWRPQDSVYGCLEVTDTGCGIAHSDIEKLFDPFFSNKLIGRGLGLAVVLGIAKAHHGAVAVQSDPGQGSTFRVFLPASAENVVV